MTLRFTGRKWSINKIIIQITRYRVDCNVLNPKIPETIPKTCQTPMRIFLNLPNQQLHFPSIHRQFLLNIFFEPVIIVKLTNPIKIKGIRIIHIIPNNPHKKITRRTLSFNM